MAKRTKKESGITVAITGARCSPALAVIDLLNKEKKIDKIVVIDLEPPGIAYDRVCFHRVDLTAPYAKQELSRIFQEEGVDILLHMSLLNKPSHDSEWAHEFESIGTMYLIEASIEAGIRKIILKSTTMVYGAYPDNPAFLTESHPARGAESRWVKDKLNAENQLLEFAEKDKSRIVTILRLAPVLDMELDNFFIRYLMRPFVPTILGYDPLVQFILEEDAASFFVKAVAEDHSGIYNIAAEGVVPLSKAIKATGSKNLPMLYKAAKGVFGFLWISELLDVPPVFIDYLRYTWAVDANKAFCDFGIKPSFNSLDSLLRFLARKRGNINSTVGH